MASRYAPSSAQSDTIVTSHWLCLYSSGT